MPINLSGTVIGSDNQPMKNVRVELHDSNGSVTNSTYTNTGGAFEFLQVPTGSYEVIATLGLAQAQERIEVSSVPGTMVSLRLPISTHAQDGNSGDTVSVAQYRVPAKAREELKKAQEASSKGRPEEAEKHLAKALEIYPNCAEAYTLRGVLKLDAKDDPGALADLQQAIRVDPNFAMAYLVMGAALNTQSRFDEAIRALEHGEALSPNSWQAQFEMGKAFVGKAEYQEALRHLDKAQAFAPLEYPLIHLVKAHAMLALSDYANAMTELQAYLEKDPKGPNRAAAEKLLDRARAFAAKSQK